MSAGLWRVWALQSLAALCVAVVICSVVILGAVAYAALRDRRRPVEPPEIGSDYGEDETLEEYADRHLAQFAAPAFDTDEIERLRAIARADAEAAHR